jgi:Na+/pantothenate symporter
MGEIGQGSIPWVLVGSVALIFVLLRYVSIQLGLSTTADKFKEITMVKTLKARSRNFFSSAFETTWATGVGCAAGHLST